MINEKGREVTWGNGRLSSGKMRREAISTCVTWSRAGGTPSKTAKSGVRRNHGSHTERKLHVSLCNQLRSGQ